MTAYETVIAALYTAGCKVQDREPKARAQCPVHRSNGLTLSIRRLNDRAAVKCFAGCETEDVLREIGLAIRDLYDEPRGSKSGSPVFQRRELSPWEKAMRDLGIHNAPPIEHVLDRMVVEQAKEGAQ